MTEEDLEEVTELSGVLDAPDDYISSSLRKELHDLLPNSEDTKCNEFVQTYIMLKQRYSDSITN